MSLFDEATSHLDGSKQEAARAEEQHQRAVSFLARELNQIAPEFIDAVQRMSPPKNARQARAQSWKVYLWLGSKNIDSLDPKESVNIVFSGDGTWKWADYMGVPNNVPPAYSPRGLADIAEETIRADVRSEILRFLTGQTGPR
jgi:hypothetical protein